MRHLCLACCFILFLAGCATTEKPIPGNIHSVNGLKQMADGGYKHKRKPHSNNIRVNAIQEVATSLGAQSGLAERSKLIDRMLEQDAVSLDKAFNFRQLLMNNNVLPPVLVEGEQTLTISNNTTLRIADRSYHIIQQARFVTAPPNWRQYVWMTFSEPEFPHRAFLPKNKAEKALWKKYVEMGWNQGTSQANRIFADNLDRLKRDMKGMITYHRLLAQHMVSAPFVSKADLGVTGNGTKMRINDKVLRIVSLPRLDINAKGWKPAVAKD